MLKRASILFAIGAAAASAAPASAQRQPDYSGRPTFETIDLRAGFRNDPRTVNVTAGGRLSATSVGSDCRGSIGNAPDVRVNYSAGSLPLSFYVNSGEDTTLVINGPDGRWYCNDDDDGLNPRVTFRQPQSGQYDIYVGHFGGGRRIPARLFISEVNTGNSSGGDEGAGSGGRPDLGQRPIYSTLPLRDGFGSREVNLTAGGPLSADQLGDECRGVIASQTDVRVNYTAGRSNRPLVFNVDSRDDTTLVINGPDGRWYCNDDTDGRNPQVRFDRPRSGQYDVFVGHYQRGQTAPARLTVSEGRRGRR